MPRRKMRFHLATYRLLNIEPRSSSMAVFELKHAERALDWFVGARNASSLGSALRAVWRLDGVGAAFYDCSKIGKAVLTKLRTEA